MRKKKKRQQIIRMLLMILTAVLLVAGVSVLLYFTVIKPASEKETLPVIQSETSPETQTVTENEAEKKEAEELLNRAKRLAGSYDYDAAAELVKTEKKNYAEYPELAGFVSECMAEKALLVKWSDNTKITHVFFHSLIADKETAFSSGKCDEYNEFMTTIPEFEKILDRLYEGGYVLVHLSDIAKMEDNGDGTQSMKMQPIYLPQGKKPIVLSVDDLSYYDYMTESGGFADRLVIDENGRIVNEIDQADGSVIRGNYDVIPILDAFVEAHPDFSYRGAKGTVALTGYNGILGYRTSDITYGPGNETYPSAHTYDNPNIEADKKAAKEVAEAMKAEGWKFASHTWGHINMERMVNTGTGEILEKEVFGRQMQWWADEVIPLIGETDIIIFADGVDMGSWRGYTDENEAFMSLKNFGFDYFCNVDSSQHSWVQISQTAGGDGYFRQARRNLDGQLLFKSLVYPEEGILSDLFDARDIFDQDRPLPVAGVTIPEGFDVNILFQ